MKSGRVGRRVVSVAFVAAAFIFLGIFVTENVGELRSQEWSVRPGLLALSVLVQIVGLVWGVAVWKLLLRAAGFDVPLARLARIYFVSALGRYIPGKIWQFVGAAHIGRSAGLPVSVTVTALAAHTFYFLASALLVGVYLLPPGLGIDDGILSAARWIAPILVLLLIHPVVLSAVFRIVGRVTGREMMAWRGSWGDALRIVLLAVIGWAVTGGALYLFLLSLTPLPWTAIPAVIGINAISFIVGNLVFIAPAGLGAKEGALAVMLAAYMTAPGAALVAIAARLWTIVAEILPALFLLRVRAMDDTTPIPPIPPRHDSPRPVNP